MAHVAIIGPTMCGKTTLAEVLAARYLAAGVNVLVCDPLFGDWPCTWQTLCRTEFIRAAKESRRCALFIDEAGQSIARDKDAEWLFTTARHWGHVTHVMSQGGTQLTPTMRAQCSRLFLFGCTPSVAAMWAEEFNEPVLLLAPYLPRFHYFFKERYQRVRHQRLTKPPLLLAA